MTPSPKPNARPTSRGAAPSRLRNGFLAALSTAIALVASPVPAAGPAPGPARASRPAEARATDANITKLATDILGHSQFAHHPLDADLAAKFLDRFLAALDGTHSIFLQADVNELAATYRTSLAKATLTSGDTSAARAVFGRYLERLRQQVAYATGLLRAGSFDFSGHDVYAFDRRHAPRPVDLEAAHELWRQQVRAEYLQEKLTDKKPATIATTLVRRREQQLRTMEGLHEDEVLEMYLDTLAHVYDPHSDYLGHEQMESFSIAMKLSLFGIGAALETDDGYCTIQELLPGGPAARSGQLKPGDRIVSVAQGNKEAVDIMNMPLSRAVELIRGPKGTRVTLTILPAVSAAAAAPRTVSLVRDEIKLEDQQAKARILDVPTPKGPSLRLGVIDLPSFYADMGRPGAGTRRSATADVARLLKKLKSENVRGVVMDLRRNGGGSLEEAITLTGLFIRKGPVVQTRDQAGKIEVGTDDDGSVLYDGPLVLLTSRFSASATEILAGALQDYGRAVLVGDPATYGKGTVQTILMLAPMMDEAGLAHAYDPGALKITISKFYRPSGASTQLHGVASDLVLPSATDFSDVSEASLDDPLPWDTVPAARFERLDRVAPYLPALGDASAKRVKADRGFTLLLEDLARVGKSLVPKPIVLNEADLRREQAESKARRALETEARALDAARPVIYEITLANADQPGLPAPVPAKSPGQAKASAAKRKDERKDEVKGEGKGDGARPRGDSGAKGEAGKHPGADPERDESDRASGDLILRESVRILGDYVGQLEAKDKSRGTSAR